MHRANSASTSYSVLYIFFVLLINPSIHFICSFNSHSNCLVLLTVPLDVGVDEGKVAPHVVDVLVQLVEELPMVGFKYQYQNIVALHQNKILKTT